jgi:hypothetical protein
MDSSSSMITPEDVLESLMNDGTIDTLRLKIINQLKANVNICPFPSIFFALVFSLFLSILWVKSELWVFFF